MSGDPIPDRFWAACATGNVETLRRMLRDNPTLVRERTPEGSTALHLAVRHPEALTLLIGSGADPNVRDAGDNASPLHFAAAAGLIESVRILLDAGADVHGAGDLHKGDVIGWAARQGNDAVLDLLLARGARHHIFSAMATGDLALVRRVIDESPDALSRRRSVFENVHTALHAAIAPPDGLGFLAGAPNHQLLQLLIDRGADVNATDNKGRTPLALAMLRGDREAMRMLNAAGAVEPDVATIAGDRPDVAALAQTITKSEPMFLVSDMRATVQWYESIGFSVTDRYEDGGELVFAKVSFGNCEFGLSPGRAAGAWNVSLWIYTDRIQEIYNTFKARQLRAARAVLAGSNERTEVPFEEDLYEPFYGGQQFSVRDPNGLTLIFWQPKSAAAV